MRLTLRQMCISFQCQIQTLHKYVRLERHLICSEQTSEVWVRTSKEGFCQQ